MVEIIPDKVIPHSIEAEMAVLGCMIIEKEAIERCLEILDDRHFYRDAHRRIFGVIKKLYVENFPVDTISVTEELKKEKILQDVGGVGYVAALINSVSTAANVEHYARIVREKSLLRELIRAGTSIAEAAYKGSNDVSDLIDSAEKEIFAISQAGDNRGFSTPKTLVPLILERIESLMTDRKAVIGVPSGFAELDALTSGFQPSNLVIIAGRPGMGKTSFCMNVAASIAMKHKKPVGIFSLEMSQQELMFRMVCSEAWVNSHEVRQGIISKKSWPVITTTADKIYNAPIYIDDSSNLSVLEIRTRARRLFSDLRAKEQTLSMIVIDYLQLLKGGSRFENRQQEISEISRGLKELAKDLNIPVIAVSQLSRRPEERGRDGRPQLSDLRESGALEQDADLVVFIYREEMYKAYDKDLEGKAKIIVAKQRNGPTDEIEMKFFKEFTKFERLEKGGAQ
ncbi:MAG: replicative DNA helicase [Elusimicrobia bacterium]|nr:replicative DNA helicase [Elusimicrobiota bacterium]